MSAAQGSPKQARSRSAGQAVGRRVPHQSQHRRTS